MPPPNRAANSLEGGVVVAGVYLRNMVCAHLSFKASPARLDQRPDRWGSYCRAQLCSRNRSAQDHHMDPQRSS